jgi:hypothetical protein
VQRARCYAPLLLALPDRLVLVPGLIPKHVVHCGRRTRARACARGEGASAGLGLVCVASRDVVFRHVCRSTEFLTPAAPPPHPHPVSLACIAPYRIGTTKTPRLLVCRGRCPAQYQGQGRRLGRSAAACTTAPGRAPGRASATASACADPKPALVCLSFCPPPLLCTRHARLRPLVPRCAASRCPTCPVHALRARLVEVEAVQPS